jgi:hypothetical protein
VPPLRGSPFGVTRRAMSTVTRGNEFEEKVLAAIVRELNAERLGLLPSACKVYRGKGYYSPARNADILIDISIEVTLPRAAKWSILWAWECKDYRNPLPVGEVEEFWAKLQQIGGVNVKGGIATSGPLQVSALEFAQSKGLAIIRLMPDANLAIVGAFDGFESLRRELYGDDPVPPRDIGRDTFRALTEADFMVGPFHRTRHLYGAIRNGVVESWADLFESELAIDELDALPSTIERKASPLGWVLEGLRRFTRFMTNREVGL